MPKEPETIVLNRLAFLKEEWLERLAANWKTALYTVGAVLVLFFSIFHFMGKSRSSLFADTFLLQQALTTWESKGCKDGDTFANIEKTLSRHPDLHAKVGAQLAQKLMALKEMKAAAPFTEKTLKRVPFPTDYHRRFAHNAVTVAKGDYAKALTEAKALKKDLDCAKGISPILSAFNLLRIATLEGVLGNAQAELQSWKELEEHLAKGQEAYQLLSQNFSQNDLTLREFINHRKTLLSK